MNYLAFIVFVLALLFTESTNAVACYGGAIGCTASCKIQNCAYGYCTNGHLPPRDQICVCARCGIGR